MENHVIVIEFPWGRDKDPRVPLGHASLISTLDMVFKINYSSLIFPINEKSNSMIEDIIFKIEEILHSKSNYNIDIAIGAYVWAEDIIQIILKIIKNNGFKGRIILGGPQITYSGAGLEEIYPDADVFVRGYGELALLGICQDRQNTPIMGVHYAGENDLCEQTIVDLEMLPSPWLNQVISLENQKFIRWESQRGCPFRCGFCQHKEAGKRLKKTEFKSSRVFKEIDLFCNSGVKEIAVLDPIFNASSQSSSILKRFLDNNFKGKLSLQCRAEMCSDEFIEMASKLDVKLEFGLQTIHRNEGNAVGRINNIRKVNDVLQKVNERKIYFEVSLIFGLPEQTLDSFLETVDWCLKRNIPVIKAFPLMLLRGTDIEQRRKEWNLIESTHSMPTVIQSDTFSYVEWLEMYRISEALKITESNHPKTIEELVVLSKNIKINYDRFRPNINLQTSNNTIQSMTAGE